jgi:probable F420-dependent oxidoreductase
MTPPLGTFGAWLNPVQTDLARTRYATQAEAAGYGTVWLGCGVRRVEDLALAERILETTSTITVATGIVNMWVNDADTLARSYHRIRATHGDRLLLGIGVGHREFNVAYRKPYDHMVAYLDRLDDAGVPRENRVLAALGPRTLKLAADRTAGAHPYLTAPGHTRYARDVLGANAILAPEQAVVVDADPDAARAVGRGFITPHLGVRNYITSLLRHGYTEQDLAGAGSDRLVDDLSVHGTPQAIAGRLAEHLRAGADHVAIQVLTRDGADPMPGYRALAGALSQVARVEAGRVPRAGGGRVSGMVAQ